MHPSNMSVANIGSGYVDPAWPDPGNAHDARIIIYGYVPSFALCVIAIVLFTLATVIHAFQLFKYRLWSLTPLAFGCALEVTGYIFRALSAEKDPYNIIYFVVQYFMIVTAPVFISASIYICLSKLVALENYTSTFALLRPKFLLWTFVSFDVVTTIMQIAGAAIIGTSESKRKSPAVGNNILLAGLACQVAAFSAFLVLFSIFVSGKIAQRQHNPRSPTLQRLSFVAALGAASILVFLRTTFRLVETSEGVFGNLTVHEVFFGSLEFAPIVAAVALLAIWFPGRWLKLESSEEVKVGETDMQVLWT